MLSEVIRRDFSELVTPELAGKLNPDLTTRLYGLISDKKQLL